MARLQMRFEDVRWEVMEEEQAPTTQRANRRSIALTIGHRTKKAYPWGPIFLRCGLLPALGGLLFRQIRVGGVWGTVQASQDIDCAMIIRLIIINRSMLHQHQQHVQKATHWR